jgi:hypothetical protein
MHSQYPTIEVIHAAKAYTAVSVISADSCIATTPTTTTAVTSTTTAATATAATKPFSAKEESIVLVSIFILLCYWLLFEEQEQL